MTTYCTTDDLLTRLKAYGGLFVADEDQDGTIEAGSEIGYLEAAVEWASTIIDGCIADKVEPSHARASGSSWLKHRCITLAMRAAITNGGNEVPDSVETEYTDCMRMLRDFSQGKGTIPDLTLPYAVDRPRGTIGGGLPRAVNPR